MLKKTKFTESQIVKTLNEAEAGVSLEELSKTELSWLYLVPPKRCYLAPLTSVVTHTVGRLP